MNILYHEIMKFVRKFLFIISASIISVVILHCLILKKKKRFATKMRLKLLVQMFILWDDFKGQLCPFMWKNCVIENLFSSRV